MSIILDGSTGIVSDSSASNPAMTAKGNGSDVEGYIQLNCRVNSHGVKLKSPPHSSGQSYTMILPDNQVAADKFLKVKSITGSGTTAVGQLEYATVSPGITEADIWRIDTEFDQQSQADITSNWARASWSTGSLHGYKGTGMTESSGIFTFPSTGYWYIDARLGYHARTGVSPGVGLEILGTSDGSNYFNLASAWDTAVFQSGYYEWGHMNCSTIIDVTSTTNCKVKFRTEAATNPVKFYSTAGGHNNNFIFLRIGDT